jgi:phosphatidylinositol 3,5-bisphosphate 5-phosphatase
MPLLGCGSDLEIPMTLPLKPITTCMEKYILYETAAFYYLVGCDAVETYFRVLKLNRSILKPKSLDEILTEDPLVYNKDELGFMLEMIHEGNKTTGGLTRTTIAYGLVGFVKFLDCYYFTLITQKKKVGCVGSNFIYSIKAAEVFAIRPREETSGELSIMKFWKTVNRKLNKTNTDQAESRYMGLFQFIDISKDFFFSYTYDLTHTLQHNFLMSSSNAFPPPPFRVCPLPLLLFCSLE